MEYIYNNFILSQLPEVDSEYKYLNIRQMSDFNQIILSCHSTEPYAVFEEFNWTIHFSSADVVTYVYNEENKIWILSEAQDYFDRIGAGHYFYDKYKSNLIWNNTDILDENNNIIFPAIPINNYDDKSFKYGLLTGFETIGYYKQGG